MKVCVVGAGFQGTACLWDFARQQNITHLGVADKSAEAVAALRSLAWTRDIKAAIIDISNPAACTAFLKDYDVAVSAVPYFYNEGLTRAAIEGGSHLVDMGGNTDVVMAQHALDAEARSAGVSILPDGGLAPGLVGVLAGFLIREERAAEVWMRVGGLPQEPFPPLGYRITFSPYGLLNEYSGDSIMLRNGRITRRPALEEEESITFDGLEELEAALTSGATSTLPFTFEGRIQDLTYKTIRYKGHFAQLRLLRDLGLLDDRSLSIAPPAGGEPSEIPLRDVMARLLTEKIGGTPVPDRILLRVGSRRGGIKGEPARTRVFELHDLYDAASGLTSMQRCTAFPVTVEALMLGSGVIPGPGVLKQEIDVDAVRMLAELRKRGLDLKERVLER
ncbi:MAG: saccharopine dehydrogenase NADP-binding domain-containing protein [Candidatus Eisenbacteria bacterium]|uniref:Saccharopine dehydrogenase NADP-binding domain-containing protein n=1 Tax=Eiseniibacteriota bacterium TaxID=2212470 RepID=A0A948W601_UNCEI|nr:saccharopine dehydrogenase NADP-binding domain-containing protein [Candidatus Eisenbacteria bacterium]MBU1948850.1 saccharopine dehydrogenase NADP-binding domain-containing protein [Candidatus Eisenbacteria bacterium]MBU2690580.1 saccharopine dehydrogenase NADP-binding domain-containing protein [Candidatus Eisenbacteria bacterium]